MLLVYLEPFQDQHRLLLDSWTLHVVSYWPRTHITDYQYDYSVVSDWWLLFSNHAYADFWLLKYSDHTRIVRTLFD